MSKYTLRPHQKDALKAVCKEFEETNRCYIVMACGTGKTITALAITEKLKPNKVVIFVPSLALVNQFIKEWVANITIKKYEILAVCSDVGVKRGVEDTSILFEPISFKVATDSFAINKFLSNDNNHTKIIFCTYQSSHLLKGPSRHSPFDLGIFDEAHKTAGYNKTLFATALSDSNVKIHRRLFMTATPRHGGERRDKFGDLIPLYSMDNPEVYGRMVYKLGFREAINLGLICDYKIIISAINESEQTSHRFNADYELHEKAVALQKAIKDAQANKVITFHSSIHHAKLFAEILEKNKIHKNILHISGSSGMASRIDTMKTFKSQKQAIITNARCLTEGVDVPTVDMVAFLNPKSSKIDIVQAIGRALRNAPGKKVGYIFLPLLVRNINNFDSEAAAGQFKTVWEVLNALNEQDSDLADVVKNVARVSGEHLDEHDYEHEYSKIDDSRILQFSSKEIKKLIRVKIIDKMVSTWDKMEPKLVAFHAKYGFNNYLDHAKEHPELCEYIKRLKAQSSTMPSYRKEKLQAMGLWSNSKSRWDQFFNLIAKFHNENPGKPFTRDYLSASLYNWLASQKVHYRNNTLEYERVKKLKELGVVFFEAPECDIDMVFDEKMQELLRFKERNGHVNVPQRGIHARLGKWCCSVREAYKLNKLPGHRYKELSKIGFSFNYLDDVWDKMYSDYVKYVEGGRLKMGDKLSQWSGYQRKAFRKNLLTPVKIQKLLAVGFDFDKKGVGNTPLLISKNFKEAKAYLKKHGSFDGITKRSNPSMCKWIYRIKQRYLGTTSENGKRLTEEEVQALKDIGFDVASFFKTNHQDYKQVQVQSLAT